MLVMCLARPACERRRITRAQECSLRATAHIFLMVVAASSMHGLGGNTMRARTSKQESRADDDGTKPTSVHDWNPWGPLGYPGGLLKLLGCLSGAFWGLLGAIRGPPGGLLGALGGLLEPLCEAPTIGRKFNCLYGAIRTAFRSPLGRSWGAPGRF